MQDFDHPQYFVVAEVFGFEVLAVWVLLVVVGRCKFHPWVAFLMGCLGV